MAVFFHVTETQLNLLSIEEGTTFFIIANLFIYSYIKVSFFLGCLSFIVDTHNMANTS